MNKRRVIVTISFVIALGIAGLILAKLTVNYNLKENNEEILLMQKEYNECNVSIDKDKYFNAFILNHNTFGLTEAGGEKYVVFTYEYASYGQIILYIESVKKEYSGDVLTLNIESKKKEKINNGCFPNISSIKCIMKVDKDITKIQIQDDDYSVTYEPFIEGISVDNGIYGIVDENFEPIVPFEYSQIMELDYNTGFGTFYKCCKEEGNGLMDENYNLVLPTKYSNIFLIEKNKFIVMNRPDNNDDYVISLIDREGNELAPSVKGFIDGGTRFNNYAHQNIFGRFEGDEYHVGVIDDNLNIIIDPVYEYISMFYSDTDKQFYVVENEKEEFAVFNSIGDQKTEFEKTSVYEVQTKYSDQFYR